MKDKILILHAPVIHRGYVDLFRRVAGEASSALVLGGDLLKEVRFFEEDLSALTPEEVKLLIKAFGIFQSVDVLNSTGLAAIRSRPLVLVSDELSRRFADKFLKSSQIQWESVFLRWDESHITKAIPPNFKSESRDPSDREMLEAAYAEAQKSGDWWRQVGAVVVKDGLVTARAYNRDMPDDQASYRLGNIRDFMKPGERPELSNAIHAEARIIAEAARDGVGLKGTNIYVTHFPCPMCAKGIAVSGIKKCFFGEGSANFDAEMILNAAGVEIIYVPREV